MPNIPVTSPLGYLGVLFVISGLFLVLAGAGAVQLEKLTVKPGIKTLSLGIFVVALGLFFLLPDLNTSLSFFLTPTPTLESIVVPATDTPFGLSANISETTPAIQPAEILITDTPNAISSLGTETIPLDDLAPEIPWLPLDTNSIPSVYTYEFNITIPPFDIKSVRMALAQAVDREFIAKLANDLGYPQTRPATTFTHPNVLGRDLYEQVGLPFNPNYAQISLAAAGYPHGDGFPTITIVFNPSPAHEAIANAIAAMWHDNLGINVEVKSVGNDLNEYIAILRTDTQGLFRSGWTWDVNDPNNNMSLFLSGGQFNPTHFANAEYDQLIQEASTEFRNPAARQLLYIQAERILCEQEVVIIPIFHYTKTQ